MKKIILFFIGLFIFSLTFSQEISLEEAQIYALAFISNQNKSANFEIDKTIERNYNNHKTCYIVSFAPCGFTILSAYKLYKPILAYSKESSYNFYKTPPAVELFLKQYDYTIDSILQNNNKSNVYSEKWEQISKSTNEPSVIGPLLTSKWGQSINYDLECGSGTNLNYGAYNKFIPSSSPTHCPCNNCTAGCTAIATAQIMNYWEYPAYSSYREYDWSNIVDILRKTSSFAEVDETAHFIADCAELIDSRYCADGCETRSNLLKARNSLVKDFNYSKKADFRKRTGTDKWKERIIDDLEQGFPVLYGAARNAIFDVKGHAFVCDGYDYDNDLFSFNFGWNGSNDGFYDIDSIDNYDIWNFAVFNISPEYYYGCSETIDLGEWYSENEDYLPMLDQPWAGTIFTAENTYSERYRTVYDGENVNMHAYNSVVLRQGFSVQSGGNFHAYLTDCPEQKSPKNENITKNSNNAVNHKIDKLTNLQISPNPASNSIKISYFLPQTTDYSIEIYNIFGQKMKLIDTGNKTEGNYQFYINLSFLQNGVYFCVLKTSQGVVSEKIVKI